MTEFSSLQRILDPIVAEIFSRIGRSVEREVLVWEAPFYNPGNPLPSIRYSASPLTVWIHDDVVGFDSPRRSVIHEQADYSSALELAHIFVSELQNALSSPAP
jgi:hypothetical protein